MKKYLLLLLPVFLMSTSISKKKNEKEKTPLEKITINGLNFRSIGPALTAGRIADIAVNPNDNSEYYLAAASSGVWKTSNSGNTYHPIFDSQGSYSICCITIDPSNEHVVWVGTGENNNQRSVAYGDGVYKSEDGGKSWKNKGLKKSEHIGMIKVHPKNSNCVYVAAYGPLWSSGGERGLYKTDDGGESWKLILEVDDNTGINEVHIDPENPNIMYATSHQRRRHVFTYVGGGPGSKMYKSNDGGEHWFELNNGLPSSIMGRIGMAVSPVNADVLFAIIEAEKENQGLYKSFDRGASWSKVNEYVTSGNYYQEIVCDPKDEDVLFFMDTWLHHSVDGGKTIVKSGEKSKHVDNHCMWIDPVNTKHWIVGCDGGVYETWDQAENWSFKPNLPITQFYKVAVDNEYPFYNVYGGTQDNNSLGGPSRTINNHGIRNADWYITNGGDGFESAVDPENPNIVYAQSQYGWLVRFDRLSGEKVGIKPMAKKGEKALRWNWDAPLIISPHDNERLYFAANKLFVSDDRGDSWKCISPDMSRKIDRNLLKVMGRVQSSDAIMKNKSTTMFGNIVALDESPLKQGMLYVGSDDGLVHVSKDNGSSWFTISKIKGIPDTTYVNSLVASQHEENKVYAVFNNHKRGDFKPYVQVSLDNGSSWKSISSNLPVKGTVYDLVEDHIDPDLLFVGTEFGVYFTIDGGKEWKQLKAGLPTIAVKDLEIQKRENDLVLATFGRSFYVLDDYSALRSLKSKISEKAHIFPIKDALMYVDARPLGLRGKGSQGESYYTADNPPIGAVFSYLFNDTLRSNKEIRQKKEEKLIENGDDVEYPTLEALRTEDREEDPYLLFTIYDENGNELRKLIEKPNLGINRIVWDFRLAAQTSIQLNVSKPGRYGEAKKGPLALPGNYSVSMHKIVDGNPTLMVDKTPFSCIWLDDLSTPSDNKSELLSFQIKVDKLRKAVDASGKVLNDLNNRLKFIESAINSYPNLDLNKLKVIYNLKLLKDSLKTELYGDQSLSKRDIEQQESISSRVGIVIWNMWRSRSNPTETNKMLYNSAGSDFTALVPKFLKFTQGVENLEKYLEDNEVPFTPGRSLIIDWKMERY